MPNPLPMELPTYLPILLLTPSLKYLKIADKSNKVLSFYSIVIYSNEPTVFPLIKPPKY